MTPVVAALGQSALRPLGFCLALAVGLSASAAEQKKPRGGGSRQPIQASKGNDVPAHRFDVILGRPTSNSVTASVLCYDDTSGCIVYGTEPGRLTQSTPNRQFARGEPVEIPIPGLQPDRRYYYRFNSARTNSSEYSFHTARSPGAGFRFTVTADSHLDEQTDPALYLRSLEGAASEAPDFHVDLGDTFMTEKHAGRAEAARQYLAQRYYFGQLSHSAPLFLVLGNHDGESPRGRGSESESLAVWSNGMRKRYFPNPVPSAFYSGNTNLHPEAGLLQDYYAWKWGDALFIVLDPFWFTQRERGQGDNWKSTLGAAQYQWLKHTLESSPAKYKFVFIHHLVGGLNSQARGGAEVAPFYEWGGRDRDGTEGFLAHRPGWSVPIHRLLVQNKVSVVFHGHDHLYAKQDLDGVVYQAVPQPGYPGNGRPPRSAAEYGYTTGTILGSSGYLRVGVSLDRATVDYLRPGSGSSSVTHSYAVLPK